MFIEKLSTNEIKTFFQKKYNKVSDYKVVSVDKFMNKVNNLTVNLTIVDPDYPAQYLDTYYINDFEVISNNNFITQMDFLTFMYGKFGEEYIITLKKYLETKKLEKMLEIENKNQKIIDELIK